MPSLVCAAIKLKPTERERIVEHAPRGFECDAMFREIAPSLGVIPFELIVMHLTTGIP